MNIQVTKDYICLRDNGKAKRFGYRTFNGLLRVSIAGRNYEIDPSDVTALNGVAYSPAPNISELMSDINDAVFVSAPPVCTPPSNDIPPALQVSGTNEGDIIVTDDGTWSGDAPLVYTYQWLRDNVSVIGETTQSYLLTSADHGTEISCRVTATNDCGNTSEISDSVLIPSP